MNSQTVIDIGTATLLTCAKLAGPFLIVVLAIGVAVGLLQSVTQLQEQTLSFVPKLVGTGVVIVVAGNWMLAELVNFAQNLLASVPAYLDG